MLHKQNNNNQLPFVAIPMIDTRFLYYCCGALPRTISNPDYEIGWTPQNGWSRYFRDHVTGQRAATSARQNDEAAQREG